MRAPRDKITSDDMSIAELTAPLSARAMPRSSLITALGDTVDEERARVIERRKVEHKNFRRRGVSKYG